MFVLRIAFSAVLALAAAAPALAGSLQVSPTTVDLGQAMTGTLTLTSAGKEQTPAQVRVMRWTQQDGRESLVPATDLAASPPQMRIAPGAAYTVRVVSRAAAGGGGERAYRLLVNELPDPVRLRTGAVNLLVGYSIPVFAGSDGRPAQLSWSARLSGGQVELRVVNSGGRRARLSKVKVTGGGRSLVFSDGLLGYALAGGEMAWTRPAPAGGLGATLRITGETEAGPFDAAAALQR